MRVRHWMQGLVFLAAVLWYGFVAPSSHSDVPGDGLGPSRGQVSASCPLGSSQSDTGTSAVEQATFTACLPIVLRRLQFAPPPASTATPPLTETPAPTATSTPIIHIVMAEGTLTRVFVSICQAGETHYLPESGVYLYSDSVSLHAYEGKYVRILGWSVPSPECRLVNVTDIWELLGG